MDHQRALLVVLALLQQCRAEQITPRWYATNDAFQPKPISELFTTKTSLTAKPIVVAQTGSVPEDIQYSSSPAPSSEYEVPTPAMPAGALYQVHLSKLNPEQIDALQKYEQYITPVTSIPAVVREVIDSAPRLPPTETPEISVQPLDPKQTSSPGLPLSNLFNTQTKTTFIQPPKRTTVFQPPRKTLPTTYSTLAPTIFSTLPPTFSTLPPTISTATPTYSTPPPTYSTAPLTYSTTPPTFSTASPTFSTASLTYSAIAPTSLSVNALTPVINPLLLNPLNRLPNSNYIYIYQAPQSYRPIRLLYPVNTIQNTTPTTVSIINARPTSTTPRFPNIMAMNLTSSVTVTPSSTLGLSTQQADGLRVAAVAVLPSGLIKKGTGLSYNIRVVAPLGSITNLNINPVTSTNRPRTTTTKRPTTRRTSKPKKNSYDRCLNGCRKVRDPICAAPLSHVTIDATSLRGFPSVCHMACHNSYRREPFEKVIDGSCSKLRTRIRLIDSKSKLKRDDLSKNEYTVDVGQKTIIEVSALE